MSALGTWLGTNSNSGFFPRYSTGSPSAISAVGGNRCAQQIRALQLLHAAYPKALPAIRLDIMTGQRTSPSGMITPINAAVEYTTQYRDLADNAMRVVVEQYVSPHSRNAAWNAVPAVAADLGYHSSNYFQWVLPGASLSDRQAIGSLFAARAIDNLRLLEAEYVRVGLDPTEYIRIGGQNEPAANIVKTSGSPNGTLTLQANAGTNSLSVGSISGVATDFAIGRRVLIGNHETGEVRQITNASGTSPRVLTLSENLTSVANVGTTVRLLDYETAYGSGDLGDAFWELMDAFCPEFLEEFPGYEYSGIGAQHGDINFGNHATRLAAIRARAASRTWLQNATHYEVNIYNWDAQARAFSHVPERMVAKADRLFQGIVAEAELANKRLWVTETGARNGQLYQVDGSPTRPINHQQKGRANALLLKYFLEHPLVDYVGLYTIMSTTSGETRTSTWDQIMNATGNFTPEFGEILRVMSGDNDTYAPDSNIVSGFANSGQPIADGNSDVLDS